MSLYQLEEGPLSEVVELLAFQDAGLAQNLGRFRPVWEEQLTALRARLGRIRGRTLSEAIDPWMLDPWTRLPLVKAADVDLASTVRPPSSECFSVRCKNGSTSGPDGVVIRPILEVPDGCESSFGRSVDEVIGRPISILPELLSTRFGAFVSDPVVNDTSITATLEDSSGVRYEGETVFIDEGDTLLIVVTIRRVT